MFSKDLLCRSILYPKCAREGVFDIAALLRLVDPAGDGKLYALSLASHFLLRTSAAAHAYGCHSASSMNESYEQRTGQKAPPEKVVHYLGFYDVEYGSLSAIKLEHYDVRVFWLPENGQDAHFQFELSNRSLLGTGKVNDRLRRDDRAAAMTIVGLLLKGLPERHICEVDEPLRQILEDIPLPRLPA